MGLLSVRRLTLKMQWMAEACQDRDVCLVRWWLLCGGVSASPARYHDSRREPLDRS